MDAELFDEQALANTFSELFANMPSPDGQKSFEDVDIDLNFLMNMLHAHAEGMGVPTGPAHQILSQLGMNLPSPPPMYFKPNTK